MLLDQFFDLVQETSQLFEVLLSRLFYLLELRGLELSLVDLFETSPLVDGQEVMRSLRKEELWIALFPVKIRRVTFGACR